MRVFKFGGASVKDAEAVKNVAAILANYRGEEIVVVISAMGKMTNALEKIVNAHWEKSGTDEHVAFVRDYHTKVMDDLGFPAAHPVREEVETSFVEIGWVLEEDSGKDFGFIYDQIVSHGELMSTKIISYYLNEHAVPHEWLDIRDVLQTDNTYREGKIDWDLSGRLMQMKIPAILKNKGMIITQGFIGNTSENFTTTLGREGSDYTAAILSYCLDAEEMCVWKDVPGVLSADPKLYDEAI